MASQVLATYNSDSDSDLSEDRQPIPKKKSRTQRIFNNIQDFHSTESALQSVSKSKEWRLRYTTHTDLGRKSYYDCKVNRSCPVKMYLLFESKNQDVHLYKTESQHNHDIKQVGLSEIMKQEIDQLLLLGVSKPIGIIRAFREKNIPEPARRQISTYLSRTRAKQGQPIVSLSDLDKVCKERSIWPEGDDTSFILNHMISIDENDHSENNRFRFFITTKRLLSQMQLSEVIHVDATYKLLWHGFPVLVVGRSDKNRAFHPYGIAVTHSEAEEDYEFVFLTLREGFIKIFPNQEYKPMVLVADCAAAITNGCRKVFPDINRVHCWAHVIRNVDKKLSLVPTETRSVIRNDIKILQLAKTDSEFRRAFELWFKKWNTEGTIEFVAYFKEEYFTQVISNGTL